MDHRIALGTAAYAVLFIMGPAHAIQSGGRLVVGATVISPCAVQSAPTGGEGRATAIIACREARAAEIRLGEERSPEPALSSASDASGKRNAVRVVEVIF